MSEQDPTTGFSVDERWPAARAQGFRAPEIPYIPYVQRPGEPTGESASDSMTGRMSRAFTYTPPDREAERAVREALPIGAPGIDLDQVLAAMPTWQSEAATLRALNSLIADQYVIRQHHDGQHPTLYRPVPHPSRTAEADVFPHSGVDLSLTMGDVKRGKSAPLASAMARRRALYDSIRDALPDQAPGITTQEVQRRIDGDVASGTLEGALHQMVAVRAIISHQDDEAAATYHRAGELEQP